MLLWKDPSSSVEARFGIAGDFLPASGLAPSGTQTWAGMAAPLAATFNELEFAIANLECPLNVGSLPPRIKASLGDSFSAPEVSLDYLRTLKCRVVSLANNHAYDYGPAGISTTHSALDTAGIISLGADASLNEPPEVCVVEIAAEIRVGVWCAALGIRERATRNQRGVEPATIERGKSALDALKQRGATCCVAFLHAGAEGTNRPDPDAVKIMNSLAEAGFQVVAACHSHRISGFADVVQHAPPYPALCFYGLGSLSSGVIYSGLEREGLLASIGLNSEGRIVSAEVKPLYLAGPGWGSIPAREQEEAILSRFFSVSREILDGSYERAFYSDVGTNFVQSQLRDLRLAFTRGGMRGVLSKLTRVRRSHFRTLLHTSIGTGRTS
jgi:hypothetical protein